jgi:hypothetical protein
MVPLAEVHDRFPTLDSTGIISLFWEPCRPSFWSFLPYIASAELKNGKTDGSRYPLLGLVAATVLLGHKAQRQPPPYGLGFGLRPCPSDFCECLPLSIDNGVHALSYEISPMYRESPLHITPVLSCCGDALLHTAEPLGLLK